MGSEMCIRDRCRVEMMPLDAIYTGSDPYDDALHDDLIKALAHSISLIGLQNPICIVANDIPDNPASYRLVSGRKRYTAFLKLERPTIPAHILSYAETDSAQDVRKALATTEENLVRKHYSLIELCELIGQSKAMYERIHPTTPKGKAKKPKHSGTEPFLHPSRNRSPISMSLPSNWGNPVSRSGSTWRSTRSSSKDTLRNSRH